LDLPGDLEVVGGAVIANHYPVVMGFESALEVRAVVKVGAYPIDIVGFVTARQQQQTEWSARRVVQALPDHFGELWRYIL
tara:strand:- start:3746 stop:3985 length:240 start_codon:yes stop_codon:yes gene_type:complete